MKKHLPKRILFLLRKFKYYLKKSYFLSYRYFNQPNPNFLAIGESYAHWPRPYWTLLDINDSDINLNLESLDYEIKIDRVKNVYSSHCLEHLSQEATSHLFKKIFNVLDDDGVLRIETPDVSKMINDYRNKVKKDYVIAVQEDNNKLLVEGLGFDSIYGEYHIAFLGLISCYKQNTQIPVIASKETLEEKLESLSIDEFCDWAISLQSKDELSTHGHINFWYYEKFVKELGKAGFSNINLCKSGETINNFDLSLERPHRADYSLIIEATR